MKNLTQWLILGIFLLSSCNNGENTSIESSPGITDSEIIIGAWGPLSGPAALWGNIIKGTDAYFKMINEEGGIHGRQIKFVFKDDAYDPSRTVPVVRELVQRDEIFAIAGGVGTATNMAVYEFLSENKVPWITPMSGITHWTHPAKEFIFSAFPLYFDEGDIMAKYAIEELKTDKIGIIYQNDDFGRSGLIAAQQVLQQNGLEFAAALPVEITDTDLSSHIARLKESGAEAVFLWVLPRQAAIILGTSAVVDFKPTWVASMVLSDMSLMHNITKGAWEGVVFNYPGTSLYNDSTNVQMMKYKEAYSRYYADERWGTFPAAGFMWIEPLVEGLRKAGRELNRDTFLKAMASIQNFKGSAGINLSFSEENHLGTRSVCLMKCLSANEAERVTGVITGSVDIAEMSSKLHAD